MNFISALCYQNENDSKEYNSLLGFHDQLVYYNLLVKVYNLKMVSIKNNKNCNKHNKIIIIINSFMQYRIVLKTVIGEVYKNVTGTENCFI